MEKKKIAETINVRINVGNYQHIEISKYAEKEIEYNSTEEMFQKEDQLTQELIGNLIRNMRTIPEKLGKQTDAVSDFEDRVTKALPDFMKGSEEPNLAKKRHLQVSAEEKENSAKREVKSKEQEKEVAELLSDSQEKAVEQYNDDELFNWV